MTAWNQKLRTSGSRRLNDLGSRPDIYWKQKSFFFFLFILLRMRKVRYPIAGKHFTIPPSVMRAPEIFFSWILIFFIGKVWKISAGNLFQMVFFFLVSRAAHPQTHNSWFFGCCCRLLLWSERAISSLWRDVGQQIPSDALDLRRSTEFYTFFSFFILLLLSQLAIDQHLQQLFRSFFFNIRSNQREKKIPALEAILITISLLQLHLKIYNKSLPFCSCQEIATLGNKMEFGVLEI